MSLEKLNVALQNELGTLEEQGRGKAPERVIVGYVPATGDRGPRYRLEGSEAAYLRMNSNSYLSLSHHPAVLEAADEFSVRGRYVSDEELRLFMFAWARFDPQQAFEHAFSWPTKREIGRASGAAIEAWGYIDPQSAGIRVRLVEDRGLKNMLRERMVFAWARSDDKEALSEFIMSMKRSPERQRFTNLLAGELVKQSTEALTAWVDSVPDNTHDGYKRTVFEKAAHVLSSLDPAQAAHWVARYLEADYVGTAPELITTRWLQQSGPEVVLNWAMELPIGDVRDAVIEKSFGPWSKRDRKAAEAWINRKLPAPVQAH